MLYALIDAADAVRRYEEHHAPPPELPAAKGLRWLPVVDERPTPADGETLDGPIEVVEPDKVRRAWTSAPMPLDEVKTAALAEVARRRWEAETAGVEVGGRLVDTSREARATLDQAARLGYQGAWKFGDGSFADVTVANLNEMVAAVMAHVAALIAAEAAAAAAISAATDWGGVQAAVEAFRP